MWSAFNAAKPEAMRFAHTAERGAADNEEGLLRLDAYFQERRAATAPNSAGGARGAGMVIK